MRRKIPTNKQTTYRFPPRLQESVEDDSDIDSELEEVSLDEPSAHAPRWVTVISKVENS